MEGIKRIKNKHIKEIMEFEREERHNRYYRVETTTIVWPCQENARRVNTKINYGLDTTGEKKKRTSKKKRGWKEYKQT
jgi:hypothetical protein